MVIFFRKLYRIVDLSIYLQNIKRIQWNPKDNYCPKQLNISVKTKISLMICRFNKEVLQVHNSEKSTPQAKGLLSKRILRLKSRVSIILMVT